MTGPAAGDPIARYLAALRPRYRGADVASALRAMERLRVVVLGDLIVDEYCYCRVSGTVSKWPVIAAVYEDLHRMAGGGAAIARHVRQYVAAVEYVCTVGDQDGHGNFARTLLESEGIRVRAVPFLGAFTVAKRRYITGGYPNPLAHAETQRASIRLFEIGFLPPPLPPAVEDLLTHQVRDAAAGADVVIVADFGHGLMTARLAEAVRSVAKWWSVNAQTNSSNFGFNRVTKYQAPQFVCIDELEARLPSGSRSQPLEQVVRGLQAELACELMMITQGSGGLSLYSPGGTEHAPALATTVVDPVGAGDAVLAIASLCRAAGVDDAMTAYLSACSGAIAASTVGNEEPVYKERLLQYATDLLEAGA